MNTAGINFTGALTIAFIVLKLTGVIAWAWLWVLSPLWIPVLIGGVLFAVAALFITLDDKKRKKNRAVLRAGTRYKEPKKR